MATAVWAAFAYIIDKQGKTPLLPETFPGYHSQAALKWSHVQLFTFLPSAHQLFWTRLSPCNNMVMTSTVSRSFFFFLFFPPKTNGGFPPMIYYYFYTFTNTDASWRIRLNVLPKNIQSSQVQKFGNLVQSRFITWLYPWNGCHCRLREMASVEHY